MKRQGRADSASSFEAKLGIRRHVVGEIGLAAASVFDVFAGNGQMHTALWLDARSYVGCDDRHYQDGRPAFVAKPDRVLRSMRLGPFNLFDIDAPGSPWDLAYIISARRRLVDGERVGFVMSEAAVAKTNKPQKLSAGLMRLAGSPSFTVSDGLGVLRSKAIHGLAKRMGGYVSRRWEAERPGKPAMTYLGLVIVGGEAAGAGRPDDAIDRLIADAVAHADVSHLNDDRSVKRKRCVK